MGFTSVHHKFLYHLLLFSLKRGKKKKKSSLLKKKKGVGGKEKKKPLKASEPLFDVWNKINKNVPLH